MTEVERIADQLRRAYEGGAWHGPSVSEVLQGVNAQTASKRPIPNAHTIWEIVHHIHAWQDATLRRLKGQAVKLTHEQDWPPVKASDEQSWKSDLLILEKSAKALLAAVNRLKDADLQKPISGGDYNFYFLLHGLIQHDLFHAGQIALLKK